MSGSTLEPGTSPAFLGGQRFDMDLNCPYCNHPLTLESAPSVRSRGLPALRWEWWLEPVLELEPLHQRILHVGRCTAQVHADLQTCATVPLPTAVTLLGFSCVLITCPCFFKVNLHLHHSGRFGASGEIDAGHYLTCPTPAARRRALTEPNRKHSKYNTWSSESFRLFPIYIGQIC